MTEVRTAYREELKALEDQTLGGIELARHALERTLEAVEHQDIELASMVIADDDRIDGRYLEVHQGDPVAARPPGTRSPPTCGWWPRCST